MHYLSCFCFICLSDKNLKCVFQKQLDNDVYLEIAHVVSEIITLDKEIPLYICCSCYTTLQSCSIFKRTCNRQLTRFKQYMNMIQDTDSDNEKREGFRKLHVVVDKLDLAEDIVNVNDFIKEEVEDEEHSIFSTIDKHGNFYEDIFMKFSEDLLKLQGNELPKSKQQIVRHKSELSNTSSKNILLHTSNYCAYNIEIKQENNEVPLDVNKTNFSKRKKRSTSSKRGKCEICNKEFEYLKRHMKLHSRIGYQCAVCNKQFVYRSKYLRHMNTHIRKRDFECLVCHKRFLLNSHLKEHVNIHLNIRPYGCPICNKTFVQSSTRQKHLKRHFSSIKLEQQDDVLT